jgi:hypothetical protein
MCGCHPEIECMLSPLDCWQFPDATSMPACLLLLLAPAQHSAAPSSCPCLSFPGCRRGGWPSTCRAVGGCQVSEPSTARATLWSGCRLTQLTVAVAVAAASQRWQARLEKRQRQQQQQLPLVPAHLEAAAAKRRRQCCPARGCLGGLPGLRRQALMPLRSSCGHGSWRQHPRLLRH